MKVLQKVTFLILVSLGFSTVHPMKKQYNNFPGRSNNYKNPDLRQQKQQAWQAAKHFQKMSAAPTARFEYRHPHQGEAPSARQKMLTLLFSIMMVNAEIVHMISATQKVSEGSKETINVKNSPIIHSSPYKIGQELETFGPCETLVDGSKLCCDIGENYTVICCHHSNTTGLSRCISFDPGGFIGEKSEQYSINGMPEAVKEMCETRGATHHLASEAAVLIIPRYLQNKNGTYCTVETFGTDKTNNKVIRDHDFDYDGGLSVNVAIIDQSSAGQPVLVTMVKDIAQKYNLAKVPDIIVRDDVGRMDNGQSALISSSPYIGANEIDSDCGERINSCLRSNSTQTRDNCVFSKYCMRPRWLVLPYSFLRDFDDNTIKDVLRHELGHVKQHERACLIASSLNDSEFCRVDFFKFLVDSLRTKNNQEAEADMFGVLAAQNPCSIITLTKVLGGSAGITFSLVLSRETMHDLFKKIKIGKIFLEHPPMLARIALIDVIYNNSKKARTLLIQKMFKK